MEESFPYLFAIKGQLNEPSVQLLARVLTKYNQKEALSVVSGMLTLPHLQANCFRLELLVHLIVANCIGIEKVTVKHITHWLNRQLGNRTIASMEDPAEDVFVSNVLTSHGDFLVLGGLWEVPDSASSLLIRTIEEHGGKDQKVWLQPVYALLKVSDFILRRAGLQRWQIEPSIPNRPIEPGPPASYLEWCNRSKLTVADLEAAGVSPALLEPFVFDASKAPALMQQSNQESALHSCPFVKFGDELILSMATSVTYAVRRYLLQQAASVSQLKPLQGLLMEQVMGRASRVVRASGEHNIEHIHLPDDLNGIHEFGKSKVFRLGQRRYIHLLFLADSLEQFAHSGLLYPTEYRQAEEHALNEHISRLRVHIDETHEVDSAHTLALLGHLGQAFILTSPTKRERWTFDPCRLHDLTMILQDSSGALNKLVLLLEQRKSMQKLGLSFPNTNGLLNLYAYWVEQSYCLRMPDIPHDQPGLIQLATDHLTGFRVARRQAIDEHCEPTVLGNSEHVVRANAETIYESLREVPAYVSVERLDNGLLSFCIPYHGTAIWVTVATNSNDQWQQHVAFKLWEGLQLLIYRVLTAAALPLRFELPAVEVIVDLSSLVSMEDARDNSALSDNFDLEIHRKLPVAKLIAGAALLRLFIGVDNNGELKLLSYVVAALRMLVGQDVKMMSSCKAEALLALGGRDAKVLHTFESNLPIEHLMSTLAEPKFQRPDEHIGATMRAVFDWQPSTVAKHSLSQHESCETLKQAVTNLMNRIGSRLKRFDRQQMVSRLLFLHETLLSDKQRWRATARAVRALYGHECGTTAAEQVARERSEASITLRVLVEASVCECPTVGGIIPDDYSIDELFGLMCTLINLGRDSETIYHGLASEGITIYPSGAYSFTADVLSVLGGPYALASFTASYEAAADDYETWVLPKDLTGAPEEKGEFGTKEFCTAFQSEYGLEFPQTIEILTTLFDACIESEQIVMAFSREELLDMCCKRSVSQSEVDAFISAFVLPSRSSWAPHHPVKPSDVEPWRFERRLSVMLRPIVECASIGGIRYVYGVGTMRDALGYILDSITSGRFDKDVFVSTEMRAYIGKRVKAAGRAFTHRVAEELRGLGWNVEEEVKMTRLGAGKSPNLGDIDVLAWAADGRVLAIECKRLKGARSIAEIAHTCARFKGNEGDHLHKHLRRITWLTANMNRLADFLKLPQPALLLYTPLVTSAIVPFRFVQDLPLDPAHIVPFAKLKNYVSSLNHII